MLVLEDKGDKVLRNDDGNYSVGDFGKTTKSLINVTNKTPSKNTICYGRLTSLLLQRVSTFDGHHQGDRIGFMEDDT